MGQLMDDIIHTAHSYTMDFKDRGPLDYSIESLKLVDDHLDDLSDYDLDEDALYNISSMVGCYVFETARRNYGGEYRWSEEQQQPVLIGGLPDFFVSIRAWEKVRGRLLNGSEDSIPFYIKGYQEHMEIGRCKGKCEDGFSYSATIV